MYKKQAVEQLKEYSRARERADLLAIRKKALKTRLEDDSNRRTTLAVLERVEKAIADDKVLMQEVESCLALLDEKEKCLLWHFYVQRTDDYIEILNEKLCVERSQIYRLKDKALQKFMMLSLVDFY